MTPIELTPIGVARTPFDEKVAAPRQPRSSEPGEARDGVVELFPGRGFEDALRDLESWSHLWLIFWFDRAEGWRPTVEPPRSAGVRRGVFATRAPHRPNPIGMTAVELLRVEGLRLHVRDVDLLDGTPILDVKPYVLYADSIPGANSGWLETPPDPLPSWRIAWSPHAREQLLWLEARGVSTLVSLVEKALAPGPHPRGYGRIKSIGAGYRLGVKDWRIWFHEAEGARELVVDAIETGHRIGDLLRDPGGVPPETVALHVGFVERFGPHV